MQKLVYCVMMGLLREMHQYSKIYFRTHSQETVEDLQKMMRFLLSYEQSLRNQAVLIGFKRKEMWQKMIGFDNILGEEDAISSAMGKKAHPLVRKGAFEFLGRCIEREGLADRHG